MSVKIGVIAEDNSDAEVVRAIIGKITDVKFSISKMLTHGCGKIKTKCPSFIEHLFDDKGSDMVFIFQDSDTADSKVIAKLRSEIAGKVKTAKPKRRVCVIIPVQEIEAWLIADEKAIKSAFPKLPVKRYDSPEAILSPKEELRRLFVGSNNKSRYSTKSHNILIADRLDPKTVCDRCPSFAPFYDAVSSL